MKIPYHSALYNPIRYKKAQSFEIGKSRAFVWDIFSEIPKIDADIIYLETAWYKGYDIYQKRAGNETKKTYGDYLDRINEIIVLSGLPAIVITGKHAVPHFKNNTGLFHGNYLHDYPCVAIAYNAEIPEKVANVVSIEYLAERYNKVWDFNCGYGLTGKIFAEAGKEFILTDINPECIGFIEAHAREWRHHV
jgi:hypothetical protein